MDKYIMSKEMHWPLFIQSDMFDLENAQNSEKEIINFICSKLSFGYTNPFDNSFNPLAQFGNKSTCICEDLTENDFHEINNIIRATNNHFLLAKFNDVLYIKTKLPVYANDAFENYKKCSLHYIKLGKSFLAEPFVKRSLFILLSMNEYESITLFIDELSDENKYKDEHSFAIIVNAIFSFFGKFNYTKYKKQPLILKMEQKNCDEVMKD